MLKNGQVCIVLVNDEYDEDNKTYPQQTLALRGKSTYLKTANKSGDTVFSELINDGETNKGYYVSYPESAEYQGIKEWYTKNGCNTDKMTVPYYAEFPYDPDKDGASLNNFDQNQKVELGTYTYKKNGAVYHSETVTDKHGNKSIYCYDNSGSLKLLVTRTVDKETGTVDESIAIVKSITYSVNPSLFKRNPNAKKLDELIVPPTNCGAFSCKKITLNPTLPLLRLYSQCVIIKTKREPCGGECAATAKQRRKQWKHRLFTIPTSGVRWAPV